MRVAVIGAGFSGMLAAYLLEKEGIEVTIYEKNDYIGGHCRTIVSKDVFTELGTIFSFSNRIKKLLIDLKVDYRQHFLYKTYVDESYNTVELMSPKEVASLMEELTRLEEILRPYQAHLDDPNFGYIPMNLMISFNEFVNRHNLKSIRQFIFPFLSSFGFGNLEDIQAYYVFKAFNLNILNAFIHGDRLLSIDKGMSELIKKLSLNITDIRYALEVRNVEVTYDKVKVESSYGSDYFDKVLITTKLPKNVIKDQLYNQLMEKIETNAFIACAYEVTSKNLATTYFKANLGKPGKLQFFYPSMQGKRTTLVAYAYGHVEKEIIDGMTDDIRNLGIDIKHMITVKQWYIFPHLKKHNLSQDFYKNIKDRQKTSNICLIGSLVSQPSIDNLYVSVSATVNEIISHYKTKKA